MSKKTKYHLVLESAGFIYVEGKRPYFLFTLKPTTPNGADHIRISLPEEQDSPDAIVDIHLTRRFDGDDVKHKSIAKVRFRDVVEGIDLVVRDVYAAWLANTSHVQLDDHAFVGAFTLDPSDEQLAAFRKQFSLPRGRVGVREFDDLIEPTFDLLQSAAIDCVRRCIVDTQIG